MKNIPSVEGVWSVSTEGDAEGRSMAQLGAEDGHFAEVALKYGDQQCYKLNLTPSKSLSLKTESKCVNVSVPYEISDTNASNKQMVSDMQEWLGNDYVVSECNFYRSVTIQRRVIKQ